MPCRAHVSLGKTVSSQIDTIRLTLLFSRCPDNLEVTLLFGMFLFLFAKGKQIVADLWQNRYNMVICESIFFLSQSNTKMYGDRKLSDIDLFNSNGQDTNPSNDSLLARRMDGQWLYTVASRDGLSVALKRRVKYSEVFSFADKYVNEILGRDSLLFNPDESRPARYYRDKANLLTENLQRQTGSSEARVRPIEVLDREIKELEDLLKSSNAPHRTQREKLQELYDTRREFEREEIARRRESEVLLHEWKRGLDLPTLFSHKEDKYHDFALPGERVMRIRFTHETKAEDIAGVDLIYEYHRPKEKRARLAAVQYKLPKGNSPNIIITDDIQDQLDRMCTVFCENDLCVDPSLDDKPLNNRPYVLPHCCAFFRPTDRLQSRLATTGYHIRRCDVDRVCGFTKDRGGNKVITPEISMRHGISYKIFEELFNTERLGSRWLTYEQLQKFHQAYEVIKPFEQAGIYIQEAPEPELATLF